MKVKWDDDIPNIWKVIKFHGSKPPTSILMEYPFGCYNDTSGEIFRTIKETLLVAVWFIVP
jgi:hypothetical protein